MYRFISIYILLWFSRLKTLLGSGQFGEVYKATWSVNENQQTLELTVKTLKSGASEEDKVKFLQEAAIMGQFSHTNVIKMYGVVTMGEPVSLYHIIGLLPKVFRRINVFHNIICVSFNY